MMRDDIFTFEKIFMNRCVDLIGTDSLEDHNGFGA